MDITCKPYFIDPQSSVNEGTIYKNVFRWLLILALHKLFQNFKNFLHKPSFMGALPLVLLSTPSAVVFHFSFNKIGFSFRFSFIFSLLTPILILLIGYLIYRSVDESNKTSLVNFIFTQMVSFTFPVSYLKPFPKHFNAAPFIVIHTVKSDDRIVKLYGLKQLQRICSSGTPEERKMIYALSQPGCHPRNWMAFRDVAIEQINDVRDRFYQETRSRTIQTTLLMNKSRTSPNGQLNGTISHLDGSHNSSIVLNELYEGKQSFFVPPTLKPRAPEQFLSEIKQHTVRLPFFLDTFVDKLRHYVFRSRLISTDETLCTLLAINALSGAILHSLEEDQFGVIQKDLKMCLSALARLSIAIDAFVRASVRSCMTKSYNNSHIHAMDEELAASLKAIRSVFGPYLSELELSPTEMEVFRVLV